MTSRQKISFLLWDDDSHSNNSALSNRQGSLEAQMQHSKINDSRISMTGRDTVSDYRISGDDDALSTAKSRRQAIRSPIQELSRLESLRAPIKLQSLPTSNNSAPSQAQLTKESNNSIVSHSKEEEETISKMAKAGYLFGYHSEQKVKEYLSPNSSTERLHLLEGSNVEKSIDSSRLEIKSKLLNEVKLHPLSPSERPFSEISTTVADSKYASVETSVDNKLTKKFVSRDSDKENNPNYGKKLPEKNVRPSPSHSKCLLSEEDKNSNRKESFGVPMNLIMAHKQQNEAQMREPMSELDPNQQGSRNLSKDPLRFSYKTLNQTQCERVATVINRIFAETSTMPKYVETFSRTDISDDYVQDPSNSSQPIIVSTTYQKDPIEGAVDSQSNNVEPERSKSKKSLVKFDFENFSEPSNYRLTPSLAIPEQIQSKPESRENPNEQSATFSQRKKDDGFKKKGFNLKATGNSVCSPKYEFILQAERSQPAQADCEIYETEVLTSRETAREQCRNDEYSNALSNQGESESARFGMKLDLSSAALADPAEGDGFLSFRREVKGLITPEFKELGLTQSNTDASANANNTAQESRNFKEKMGDLLNISSKKMARILNFDALGNSKENQQAVPMNDCNLSNMVIVNVPDQTPKRVQKAEHRRVTFDKDAVIGHDLEDSADIACFKQRNSTREHRLITQSLHGNGQNSQSLSTINPNDHGNDNPQASLDHKRLRRTLSTSRPSNQNKTISDDIRKSLNTSATARTPKSKETQFNSGRSNSTAKRVSRRSSSVNKSPISSSLQNDTLIGSDNRRSRDKTKSLILSVKKVKEVEIFLGEPSNSEKQKDHDLSKLKIPTSKVVKSHEENAAKKIQEKKGFARNSSEARLSGASNSSQGMNSVQRVRSPSSNRSLTFIPKLPIADTSQTTDTKSTQEQLPIKLELVPYPVVPRKSTPNRGNKIPEKQAQRCSSSKKCRPQPAAASNQRVNVTYGIEHQRPIIKDEGKLSDHRLRTEAIPVVTLPLSKMIQLDQRLLSEQFHNLQGDTCKQSCSSRQSSKRMSGLISPDQAGGRQSPNSKKCFPSFSQKSAVALEKELRAKSKELIKNAGLVGCKQRLV